MKMFRLMILLVLALVVLAGPMVPVHAQGNEPSVVVEESNSFPTWGIALAVFSVLTIIVAALERKDNLEKILQRLDNDTESKKQVQKALSESIPPAALTLFYNLALGAKQGGEFLSGDFKYPGVPKELADQFRSWANAIEAAGDYAVDVATPIDALKGG